MPNSTVATLNFDYMFTAVAGVTYSYQLLGETGLSTATVDHTINIDVPAGTLSKVLCYGSNWYLQTGSTGVGETGSPGNTYYQPEPAVALLLTTVLGGYLDDLTAGLTGVTSGITYVSDGSNNITDDASATIPNLVKKFQTISGFTYLSNGLDDGTTGVVVDYLSQIPVEAIHSVIFSQVNTLALSEVTGDLLSTNSQGQTMAHSGLSGAIQSLFEQAVGAGMVTAGTSGITGVDLSLGASWPELSSVIPTTIDALDTSIAAGGSTGDFEVYGATFTVGQSLGIFVQYDLQKVRQYQLSAQANLPVTYTAGGSWQKATQAPPTTTQLATVGNILYVHVNSSAGSQSSFLTGLQGAIDTAGPSGLKVLIGSGGLYARFTSSSLAGSIYAFTATSAVFGLVNGSNYSLEYSANGPVDGATGVTTLTFGGETFDTVLGNAAEISVPVPVVYQIVFTAT
jgi:hypothetical protein